MNDLKAAVREVLDDTDLKKLDIGVYIDEIDELYGDYRDKISEQTAVKICLAEHPEEELHDIILDSFVDYEGEHREALARDICKQLFERGKITQKEYDENNDLLTDILYILYDIVEYDYPYDLYLSQEFNVTILMDTGDGKYDFTFNTSFDNNHIHELSSLLWLARQQGYTKEQLEDAIFKADEDTSEDPAFLKRCREEIDACTSGMNTVVFLVKMTLRELIELNKLIKREVSLLPVYDTTKNPDCGVLTLGSDVMTGLFDPWNGAGGLFELSLEKNVQIPIRFIREALPDRCIYRYGVAQVYGFNSYAWSSDILSIEPPTQNNDHE